MKICGSDEIAKVNELNGGRFMKQLKSFDKCNLQWLRFVKSYQLYHSMTNKCSESLSTEWS